MQAAPALYRRHRFPSEIISHSVCLYFRFALSYRDVEEIMAVRGLLVSVATARAHPGEPLRSAHKAPVIGTAARAADNPEYAQTLHTLSSLRYVSSRHEAAQPNVIKS